MSKGPRYHFDCEDTGSEKERFQPYTFASNGGDRRPGGAT